MNSFPMCVRACVFVVLVVIQYGSAYMVGNNPYHQVETLDSQGKYRLEWLVDLKTKRITFNVTVETKGYVGFGLSGNGKMTGADIVIGGVRRNGKSYFSDRHAVGNHLPELDPSQDWTLHAAWESGTKTFLSFSRALDTCDPQDYAITENKITLIWAFGEKDDEIEYHHENKGVFDVYLLAPNYVPPVRRDRSGKVIGVVGNSNLTNLQAWTITTKFVIPDTDTTYWCTVHTPPKLKRKQHIIGVEVRFPSEQSKRHVHHMAIHKCHAPVGSNLRTLFEPFLGQRGQSCLMLGQPNGPIPTQYCTEFFWAWAIGGRLFFYPPHVGTPLGESSDEFFIAQMHYDNPNRLSNVEVEASLDFIYTSNLRQNDGGILVVRTPTPGLTPTILIPPSTVDHNVYAHCSPECTRAMLPKAGIKIAGAFLHAHNSGVGIRFQHFRKNKELPWILADDNYDNNYQETLALQQDRHVLPGDHLTLSCTYDNTWTNGTVVAGYSTRQEMCVTLAIYYNKFNDYNHCISEQITEQYRQYFLGVRNITWSAPHLEYIVDPPHRLAGLPITEVSDNHVNWTLDKRAELRRFHLYHTQANRCPRTQIDISRLRPTGDGRLVNMDDISPTVTYPVNASPYAPPETCSSKRKVY